MSEQTNRTTDLNIVDQRLLPPPRLLKSQFPLSSKTEDFILSSRQTIQGILRGTDPRIFVLVGPCSIHNVDQALAYAERLRKLRAEVADTLVLVMRGYFEKPRTSIGWKGLINDPHLNDTFAIEEGLAIARKLLLDLAVMEVPVGTEALDPVTPQYIDDLISWTAIGARTTESQTHREMASGLSSPVGFKNGTDGNIEVAVNALRSVSMPHHFLGINQDGQSAVMKTRGNRFGHIVLRGGGGRPNYDSVSIAMCEKVLEDNRIPPRIMVDCSHGNSMKDYTLQPLVFDNCINQVVDGNNSIVGMMIESNLEAGNQAISDSPQSLKYGVSITDACIDWSTTEGIIQDAAAKLRPVLSARNLR